MISLLLLTAGLSAAVSAAEVPRLSLDEVKRLAVERNPDTRSAALAEEIARIDASRARLDRFALTLGTSAGAEAATFRTFDGLTIKGTSSTWDARARGEVPLYAGGRIDAAIERADAGARIAGLDRQITARELERAAYRSYWTIKGYELQIEASEEGLRVTEQALAIIRAKADAGLSAGIDVNRSEVDLLSQQAGLVEQRSALYGAKQELLRLLQLPGDDVVLTDGPPAPRSGPVELPDGAGEARPELARAEASAAQAEAGVKGARSGTLPTVALVGEAGLGTSRLPTSPAFDPPIAEPSTDASVGLQFTWNPFDLWKTRDAVQQARLGVQQVEAQQQATASGIQAELKSAAAEVRQLRERAPLVSQQVALARDNLQIVQDLYSQGSATILDLFNAQSSFRSARIQEASLQVQLATAEDDLRWLLGQAAPGTP